MPAYTSILSQILLAALIPLSLAAATTQNIAAPATTATATAPATAPIAQELVPLQQIIDLGRDTNRQSYPDADSVVLVDSTRISYTTNGTYSSTWDRSIKVLTEKGRREAATQSIPFVSTYETARFTQATILKPDGSSIPIDIAANSQTMVDSSQMKDNIYDPSCKVINLNIPGIEIGDTLRYCAATELTKTRFGTIYSEFLPIEEASPIRLASISIDGPASLPLRTMAILGAPKGVVNHLKAESNGRICWRWDIKDIPMMEPEPDMPESHSIAQRLLVSTCQDWSEISRWYWNLCAPHLRADDAIKAEVARICAGKKTDDEKLMAVFTFVSQQIRYLGLTLETEAPGYEPHDTTLTFKNRYGVCRDKAALLATMLREAGFKAFPVIINAGTKLDVQVPIPMFNHAIVAVETTDRDYRLMDPTDENAAEPQPSYLDDCSYLVARPEGETLRTSKISSPERNAAKADTRLFIDVDGSITGTVTLGFLGINDTINRSAAARAKADEIRNHFETHMKDLFPGAVIDHFRMDPEDPQDTSRPLSVTFEFRSPSIWTEDKDKALLPIPWLGSRFSVASRLLAQNTGLAARRYPLSIGFTSATTETIEIVLPKTIKAIASMPVPVRMDTPSARLSIELTNPRDNIIQGRCEIALAKPEVPAAEYIQLKDAIHRIEDFNHQGVILERENPDVAQAGSLTRFRRTECTVESANNWTVTETVSRKILTYGGMKDCAEVTATFNPAWEDVSLDYARVTMKDGSTRQLEAKEINFMDAPWVATAPRYPRSKTLVASLPGVDVGSTIEYRLRRTFRERPFFSFCHYFASTDPIESDQVVIQKPDWLDVAVYGVDTTEERQVSGQASHIYTANRPVPPFTPEPAMPPVSSFAPVALASSAPDELAFPRLLGETVRRLATPTDALRTKAAELTSGLSSADERIRALRNHVARSVRLDGPNFLDLPLASLSPAETTLAQGYGHEADRAILLHALLEAAGLHPEFFLAADGPRRRFEKDWAMTAHPQYGFYNRLLVRVQTETQPIYLSPIDEHAQPGCCDLDGAPAVPLNGQPPFVIDIPENLQSKDDVSWEIHVEADGAAVVTCERTYGGEAHTGFVRDMTEATTEGRRRHEQEFASAISHAAIATKPIEVSLEYPAHERITVRIPSWAKSQGGFMQVPLPRMELSGLPSSVEKRELPYLNATRISSSQSWMLTIPANTAPVILPRPFEWMGPDSLGSCRMDIVQSKDPQGRKVIELRQQSRFTPCLLPSSAHDAILDLNKRIDHPSLRSILLKVD